MAEFIGLCAILIVALSPLLRRSYIDRFWVHERGIVIHLEVGIDNSEAAGAWAWFPVIEYHAAGHRFTLAISYWHRFNPKPEYLVGDKIEIILYNPRNPSRFILDSWMEHIILTSVVSIFILAKIRER